MSQDPVQICEIVFDIVIAQRYTNDAWVADCGTQVEYGGGTCDPDAKAAAVFEAINSMRQ